TREVVAPTRGPWADEDLEEGTTSVVLTTGEVAPGTRAGPDPVLAAPEEGAGEDVPSGPEQSVSGWAMPSVFGGAAGAGGPPSSDKPALSVVPDADSVPGSEAEPEPVEESSVVETPAPHGQDIADEAPEQEPELEQGAAEGPDGEDEELPSFDFLFGNTSHHRSSLLSGLETEAEDEARIDSGPVAAAGGYQAPEDPANVTLAPPEEDEEPEPAPERDESEPPISAAPGGLPPMPGSSSEPAAAERGPDDEDPAGEALPSDPPAAAAPIAAPSEEVTADDPDEPAPAPALPQFVGGHLVGSRVPDDRGSEPAAAPLQADQGGMIS